MNIGITGVRGFIGSHVAGLCAEHGHTVTGFSRNPGSGQRPLPPDAPPDLRCLDAVVHLAGEPIIGLWTAAKKRRIYHSRIQGTRRVVEALSTKPGPRILICASAIGYYGDTGEIQVDESAPADAGFLAEVARDWEAEAAKAEALGVRVVRVRIGFVLGNGGALSLIKPIFSLGLGGPLGNGRQWMSGIHVEDVAGLIVWAIENETVRGALNAVMPEPFRNSEFTKAVASTLHRPAILPAPAFALRLALGGLSHLLLDSARVVPRLAMEGGYAFRHRTLTAALAG